MKNVGLCLVLSVLLPTFSSASDFVGGVIYTKEDNQKMAIKCSKKDKMSDSCRRYDLYYGNKYHDEMYSIASFTKLEIKKVRKKIYKESVDTMARKNRTRYVQGTGTALVACVYAPDTRFYSCPLIPVGLAIDIVKLPIVAGIQILTMPKFGHNKIKSNKLLTFMLDEKHKGKEKNISGKWFDYLKSADLPE